VLPRTHPSPYPKWHLDRFTHCCSDHSRRSHSLQRGRPFSPQNCPFCMEDLHPCFHRPVRVHNLNGISISSAVLARPTIVLNRKYVTTGRIAVLLRMYAVLRCDQKMDKRLTLLHLVVICQITHLLLSTIIDKSSAVAEMGDHGHNRHGPKRGGAAVPLSRELGPSLIQCGACAEIYFGTKWRLHPSSHLLTIDMSQKLGWGGCAFFSGGSWVPIEYKVAWAEAYRHTKWHLSPSSHLATVDTGRKLGAVPL